MIVARPSPDLNATSQPNLLPPLIVHGSKKSSTCIIHTTIQIAASRFGKGWHHDPPHDPPLPLAAVGKKKKNVDLAKYISSQRALPPPTDTYLTRVMRRNCHIANSSPITADATMRHVAFVSADCRIGKKCRRQREEKKKREQSGSGEEKTHTNDSKMRWTGSEDCTMGGGRYRRKYSDSCHRPRYCSCSVRGI